MKKRLAFAVITVAIALLAFGAVAFAQTATPTGTAATATATSVITGTATVTVTVTVTGTLPTQPTFVPTVVVSTGIYQAGGGPFEFAHPAFSRVWDRTDHPVRMGQVSRTWFWGPGPNTPGLLEQYNESTRGDRLRLVQYYDKSRMEVNNPNADQRQPFFVTNGLLTVEMVSGFVQVGEKDFVNFRPACIPMSGDFGDRLAPTYFGFQKVSNTQAGDHPAPNRNGQRVTETIDRDGNTGADPSKANVTGTELVHFAGETRHNIPRVFWDFLNSSGPTHNEQHQVVNQQLISPWFFASGLPISEPYWAKATISSTVRDVLVQAYERRVLTYVPTNQAGWQVEMGNIGQHYFDWRYRNFGICPGTPAGTPSPPVPAPTGTVVAGTPVSTGTPGSPTRTPTATPTLCPGCPTWTATPTEVVPPATVIVPGTPTRTPTAAPTTGR